MIPILRMRRTSSAASRCLLGVVVLWGRRCARRPSPRPDACGGEGTLRDAAVRRRADRQPYGPCLTCFPNTGVENFHCISLNGIIVQVAILKLIEWRRARIIELQNH